MSEAKKILTENEIRLLMNMFRHFEKNVETDLFCMEEDQEDFEEAYEKMMNFLFGGKYYS